MNVNKFLFRMLFCFFVSGLMAQNKVERVHVLFKTHLDVGFTDLSSKVEQRYITEFIPKAIAVGEQLQAEGSKDRYVWTTGSWLIDAYLKQASPEAVTALENAICRRYCGLDPQSHATTKKIYVKQFKLKFYAKNS